MTFLVENHRMRLQIEPPIQVLGQLFTTPCKARASIVGIPNGRFSSFPGFGIQTLRVGLLLPVSLSCPMSFIRASGDRFLTPSTPAGTLAERSCRATQAKSLPVRRRHRLLFGGQIPTENAPRRSQRQLCGKRGADAPLLPLFSVVTRRTARALFDQDLISVLWSCRTCLISPQRQRPRAAMQQHKCALRPARCVRVVDRRRSALRGCTYRRIVSTFRQLILSQTTVFNFTESRGRMPSSRREVRTTIVMRMRLLRHICYYLYLYTLFVCGCERSLRSCLRSRLQRPCLCSAYPRNYPFPACSVHMLGYPQDSAQRRPPSLEGGWGAFAPVAVRFSGNTRCFELGICFRTHLFPVSPYGLIPTSKSGDEIGLLRSYYAIGLSTCGCSPFVQGLSLRLLNWSCDVEMSAEINELQVLSSCLRRRVWSFTPKCLYPLPFA